MALIGHGADGQSQPYIPLEQMEPKDGTQHTVAEYEINDAARRHDLRRSRSSVLNLICLVLVGLIPIISMSFWGGFNLKRPEGWTAFSSAPIGGHFTQPQAKAMDILCSAILAPAVLFLFNYLWFTSGRVAAVVETDKRPTSLKTLSIVSSSAIGSYNIFDLWQLIIRSKAPRVVLLGFLILSAAIANSALTNVIAYEAYMIDVPTSHVELQYLWDNIVQGPKFTGSSIAEMFEFNDQQTASFSEQFTGVLTGLSIANARGLLNGTEYYLVNATTSSLNALDGNIIDLPEVPALKYEIDCHAATPIFPGVITMGQNVQLSLNLNASDNLPFTRISSTYPGQIETLQSSYNERYDFLGFPTGLVINESYTGFLTSFNLTNDTAYSKYGLIQPVAVNMSLTDPDFSGTKSIMSWWGMRCWILETSGTADLHRTANASWTTRSYQWNEETRTVTPDWIMNDLQVALDYNAPGSTLPGIGSALTKSVSQLNVSKTTDLDYETFALNILYAESEAKRILYETTATNRTRASSDFFYEITATSQSQVYRLTYVPFVLFVGELAILTATGICLVMIVATWNTASGRRLRRVDVLRVIVDAVIGLRFEDDEHLLDKSYIENDKLDHWANGYYTKYHLRQEDNDTRSRVTLTQVSKEE